MKFFNQSKMSENPKVTVGAKGGLSVDANELFASPKVKATIKKMAELDLTRSSKTSKIDKEVSS